MLAGMERVAKEQLTTLCHNIRTGGASNDTGEMTS